MHLLQSEAWEKYLQSDGATTLRLDGKGWTALAVKKSTPLGPYLFLPYGPAVLSDATDQTQTFHAALLAVAERARQENCLFVRCEPTFTLSAKQARAWGLTETKEIDPKHTWVLDLDASEEEILAGIGKHKVRLWRKMANKGMSVRTTQDPEAIGALTQLLAQVSKSDHFTPQSEAHLKNQLVAGFATLYTVELAEARAPIAAALVYDYDGVRCYAHAASDYEHRKLCAGAILLVQMIMDAKAAGAKTFDFWGITTSSDPNHPWAGFTQFKQSFGGRQVDYGGTWDLPLSPAKYKLYTGLRKVNLVVRKKLKGGEKHTQSNRS